MSPVYPIPFDDRLSDRLVAAVADLLADRAYGLPFVPDDELDRLRQALHGFLYRPALDVDEAVREVLDGTGPLPAGVDPAVGGALRGLAEHFRTHGCLVPADEG